METQLDSANNEIEKEKKLIKALNVHNTLLAETNIKLRKSVESKGIELERLKAESDEIRFQLNQIWNSNSWRLLSKYWKLRDESILRFIIKPVRYIVLKIIKRS